MTSPAHSQGKGIIPKLGHQIIHLYDLLSGPAMTEQDRIHRELAESEPIRRVRNYGL
ncbi:MAG: hypothetical protein O2909_13200 [Chloroflexi bacterium]|nr:hypothetical protein [Chloroflexota bacterium]MDA1220363.1 hypothetical protein [Chloroflexota bacterium]